MKPDIAVRWTKALRSGKYEQGINYLALDGKYCCLGVLCELAVEEGVATRREPVKGDGLTPPRVMYNESDRTLPESVMEWAGLLTEDGLLGEDSLAALNDTGMSFTEIADFIERHVEEL